MRPAARLLVVLGTVLLALFVGLAFRAQAQGVPPVPRQTPAQTVAVVQDAGTLAQADKDLFANTFVAGAMAVDGGAGKYGYKCEQDPCTTDFGAGTQDEVTATNNTLTWNVSDQIFATIHVTQPANNTNTNVRWYTDPGYFFGLYPTADTTGCAAGSAGGLRAFTDGGVGACDGTTLQRFPYILTSDIVTVDFPNLNPNDTNLQEITFTGAVASDMPLCGPVNGSSFDGLDVHPEVTDAGIVGLRGHNDSTGAVNLAPVSVKCQIFR